MPIITRQADIMRTRYELVPSQGANPSLNYPEGPQEAEARQKLREHLARMLQVEHEQGDKPLSGTHPLTKERDRLFTALKRSYGR